MKRALISVSDKSGILEFAKGLATLKVEILSTGGTAKLLRENGIPVVEVSDYTGQPEILDGRLKTLHPKIHGGILGVRSNPKHIEELKKSGIEPIDLVVVNLYPFEQKVAKPDVDLIEAIENIDIGGPTMIRAAAKNWQDVTVIVDPADYEPILTELRKKGGEVSKETNFRLAQKVFVRMARYDGAIANYLTGGREGKFPDACHFQGIKVQDLRYGENPHQRGAFYKDVGATLRGCPQEPCVSNARQLHGKELSFNNILDLDAAIELVKEFEGPACVIIKHTNPCGVAVGADPRVGPGEHMGSPLREIFIAACACDPLSAFGGIIGFNREVDPETAQEIAKDFYECVVAPSFSAKALETLKGKKNIRLMEIPPHPPLPKGGWGDLDFKRVTGGLLVQDRDCLTEDIRESKVVTKRGPTEEEWRGLEFAWRVCKHVKSNAIVLAGVSPLPSVGEGLGVRVTLGIGCGQMSRIDSTKIAILKSQAVSLRLSPTGFPPPPASGGYPVSVMASDAFFPFRDNVDETAKAGITAIIQPGGSLKDQDSIAAAEEHGMAMVFTGIRHFRH